MNVQMTFNLNAKSWEVTDEFWDRAQALIPLRLHPSNKNYVRLGR
jgi:hypothetical protein